MGFAFITCQIGFEAWAKRELTRTRPTWKLAYSRPGFITFKTPDDVGLAEAAPTAFARSWGRSLGRAVDADGVIAAAMALRDGDEPGKFTRVHALARDPELPVDELADVAAKVATGLSLSNLALGDALVGDLVLDIIAAPGEPMSLGVHRHIRDRAASVGGVAPASVPDDSPSRAYAKIEEAIAWTGLPIAAGDTALEIGSAPGGAALALVRRGVNVIGVDPGAMDEVVLAARHENGAHVEHRAIKVGALRWEDLPVRIDWLLVDVNLAPQVALHEIARLMPFLLARRNGRSLRGVVFTIKLNELAFVDELATFRDRFATMGLSDVVMTHLPANRQEVCAVARPAGSRG